MTHLALCIPSSGSWRSGTALSVVYLVTRLLANGIPVTIKHVAGTLIGQAREDLAVAALDEDSVTHLLWVDADMTFPSDAAERLLAHDKAIVAANYTTRRLPLRTTASKNGKRLATSHGRSGLEVVDHIGFGLALIRREVFATLQQPWFATPGMKDADGKFVTYLSEDVAFCRKAKEQAIRCFIDHDLSNAVGHVGDIEFRMAQLEEEAAPSRVIRP